MEKSIIISSTTTYANSSWKITRKINSKKTSLRSSIRSTTFSRKSSINSLIQSDMKTTLENNSRSFSQNQSQEEKEKRTLRLSTRFTRIGSTNNSAVMEMSAIPMIEISWINLSSLNFQYLLLVLLNQQWLMQLVFILKKAWPRLKQSLKLRTEMKMQMVLDQSRKKLLKNPCDCDDTIQSSLRPNYIFIYIIIYTRYIIKN
jgi:hypothetical protein